MGLSYEERGKFEEAIEWLTPIAYSKGDALYIHSAQIRLGKAQVQLATCHFVGIEMPKNEKEGMRLLHKAARLGNIEAHKMIAQYHNEKDEGAAIKWEILAAQLDFK